jgi:hypothetical protein
MSGSAARGIGRELASSRVLLLGLVGVLAAGSAGCFKRTLRATTTQPNPLIAFPNKATHRSERLYIDVKDMDLPRTFKLRQSAYFNVVSKERLRFRVMLVHKWKEIADVTTWNVKLEDDRGHVYYPEAKEFAYDDHITKMWDREVRTVVPNQFGDQDVSRADRGVLNDGHRRRVPLDAVDVFQGAGDYVFHAKGIFHKDIRRLTLTMERSGLEYKFTWNLVDLGGDDVVRESSPRAAAIH